ncbi:hypothetical protein J2S49_001222 [Arcanobacterium wilhelmae]|uniref:Uncharacterized protein n=1 Tax=Arcanobacterium wilhelmae TaxID=1803177 RepID=A0ABT9NBQ5_9ACTO|nr:hypothetical protein [Arcanobacterium wilhelmae]MDP9801146.1 hypothetical protein [Arcanobacterium wilhelmae]WFN90498.1 hypothetical protein P8A24_01155 [Arcanobacterium wilhelmae]
MSNENAQQPQPTSGQPPVPPSYPYPPAQFPTGGGEFDYLDEPAPTPNGQPYPAAPQPQAPVPPMPAGQPYYPAPAGQPYPQAPYGQPYPQAPTPQAPVPPTPEPVAPQPTPEPVAPQPTPEPVAPQPQMAAPAPAPVSEPVVSEPATMMMAPTQPAAEQTAPMFVPAATAQPEPAQAAAPASSAQTAEKSRLPLYLLVAVLVIAVVGISAYLLRSVLLTNHSLSEPAATASAQATPSEQPSGAGEDTSPNAIATFAQNIGCASPDSDAAAIDTYVKAVVGAGEWDAAHESAVKNALRDIDGTCPKSYSAGLKKALEGASASELTALNGDWLTAARPASSDALHNSSFTTNAQNIMCSFEGDSVSCTIKGYNFPSQPSSCEGKPQTLTVNTAGEVKLHCDSQVSSSTVVPYDSQIANNGFACTTSEFGGIECWNELTGNGFRVKRAQAETF